ncbi:MAG: hypothetical protein ACFFDO_06375 [Candidatus Thorarchaeota archaeon]
MIKEKEATLDEQIREISIICPECKNSNKITIPVKVINQSKQLTTVSIPSGLVCEHGFQAFVDKNFKIRGYQKVDYTLSQMEFLEGGNENLEGVEKKTEQESILSSIPLFQDIINLLRSSLDDKDILGAGLFTIQGRVLYSSLPQNTLFNTIRELEVRDEKKLTGVKRLFLQLENDQKVCSQYMEIYDTKFILVLFFSSLLKLGMGNMILRKLAQKIEKLI